LEPPERSIEIQGLLDSDIPDAADEFGSGCPPAEGPEIARAMKWSLRWAAQLQDRLATSTARRCQAFSQDGEYPKLASASRKGWLNLDLKGICRSLRIELSGEAAGGRCSTCIMIT